MRVSTSPKSQPTPRYLKPNYKLKRAPKQGDYTRRHSEVAARLAQIVDAIEATLAMQADLDWGSLDLIVVESPSLNSKSSTLDQLWGLYWSTLVSLQQYRIPLATVSPNARARYATGNGSSGRRCSATRYGWTTPASTSRTMCATPIFQSPVTTGSSAGSQAG